MLVILVALVLKTATLVVHTVLVAFAVVIIKMWESGVLLSARMETCDLSMA